MDVSLSNVLEGTRQYFQGLPSAGPAGPGPEPGPGPGPVPGPGPGPGPGNATPNQGSGNGTVAPHYGTLAGSRPTNLQSSSPTVATSPSVLSWQSTPPPSWATVLNETPPPPPAPVAVPHRHNLPPIASLSTTFSRSAVQKLPPQRVRPRPLPSGQAPKIEAGSAPDPAIPKPKDDIVVSEAKSENELKLAESSKGPEEEPLHSGEKAPEHGRGIKENQVAMTEETQRLDESLPDAQRLDTPIIEATILNKPVLEENIVEPLIESLKLEEKNAGKMETEEFRSQDVDTDRTDSKSEVQSLETQPPKVANFQAEESSKVAAYPVRTEVINVHQEEVRDAIVNALNEIQATDDHRTEEKPPQMLKMENQSVEGGFAASEEAQVNISEERKTENDEQQSHVNDENQSNVADAPNSDKQSAEAQRPEIPTDGQFIIRADAQRNEAPWAEIRRAEAQRVESQRLEIQNIEMQRVEAQRSEMQRVEAQRSEMQRVEAQRAEMQRVEAQRSEMQRLEAQRAEMQRVEAQRAEIQRAEAQRAEMQRAEAQRTEMQRVEAQRTEMQRVEAQRSEMQRLEAHRIEMQRHEDQRAEVQRQEAQRADVDRHEAQRAEMQMHETQRAEMQMHEAQRAEMQRLEAQRAEMQRHEAQRAEMQRHEAQREMQRVEAQRAEMQRHEAQRTEMQRYEAQRAEMQRHEAQRAEMHRHEAQRVEMQRHEAQREMQRVEAQRAEMQRVEAQREMQRAEMQRAEAQRAEMQRFEAQRAEMQRIEAQRVEMQRVEAQRAEMQRVEAQRVEMQRVEAQRAETQRVEAQRAEMQRLETQKAEMQRLEVQRAEAYRNELQRNEAQKVDIQRVEALRMDAHRTDVQRAELQRVELQNLEARREAEKINERRQDAIRYGVSKQHNQMYPRHQEREVEMQSRPQEVRRLTVDQQSQEAQRVGQPRQQQITQPVVAPAPYPSAESPRHRPQPSPVHTLMSSWPQQPSPVPALLPPRHQPAPSPRLENTSPHSRSGATYVSSAPSMYHQSQMVSPQSQLAPSHYRYTSPLPQQNTTALQQAAPAHVVRHVGQVQASSNGTYRQVQPMSGQQPQPSTAGSSPQTFYRTPSYPSQHSSSGQQPALYPQQYQQRLAAPPSQQHYYNAAPVSPHHAGAFQHQRHQPTPTPSPGNASPHNRSNATYVSSAPSMYHQSHTASPQSNLTPSPYRYASPLPQQNPTTIQPTAPQHAVRQAVQAQVPSNGTYRHVQPVSSHQPHPVSASTSHQTSYRTPASPSQYSSSGQQPAQYPQQYQQRLAAPPSQQHYYNAAAPQRHEALPPVSQIKGFSQQNGAYQEVENQPSRLPPVSSFRGVDPTRPGQQVYPGLPTMSPSPRTASVVSMPPPPSPNVQQVARTSTPMPAKQYTYPGYPQAQAKQVSQNASPHTPDALGKARLYAQQHSAASASAASTSASKGPAPQQGGSHYPQRPPATATDAAPSPALPNGHLPSGVRRESPLDLSVKTVRQSADSTATDDSEVMAILDKAIRGPPAATVPKVDFTPNFSAATVHQHHRPSAAPQLIWPVASSHSTDQSYPSVGGMKRPAADPPAGPLAPSKTPCMDPWRASIDMHIEERLSKAEAQQRELKRREHESVIHHAPAVPHFGGADRRTLSILRNSLEERELQRASGVPGVPGFSGAPLPPQIKFSVPRAVDSVPPGSNLPHEADRMVAHADQDGAAAMAAMARIRTKAELKQWTGPLSTTTNINSQVSAGQSSYPLLPKDRALLSMNKGAPTHADGAQKLARGVFDFPDSNSDGEMPVLERQPLRHEKRLHFGAGRPDTAFLQEDSVPTTSNADSAKVVEKTEPEDPFWSSACDNFMAQLETGKAQGNLRRRSGGRRKKAVSPAPAKEKDLADLPSSEKAPPAPVVPEAIVPPTSPSTSAQTAAATPTLPAPTPPVLTPPASTPRAPTPPAPTSKPKSTPSPPATLTPPAKAKARVGRPPKNKSVSPVVSEEPVKRRGRLPRSAVQLPPRAQSESSDRDVSPTPSEDHKPLSQLTKTKASVAPKVGRMGTRSTGSVRTTRSGSALKTPPKVTRSSARNVTPEKKMSVRVTRTSKTSPIAEEKNEVKKPKVLTRKESLVKRQIKEESESSDEDLPLVRTKDATPLKAADKKVKVEPKKENWSESSSSGSDDSDETVETVAQRLRTRNDKRKAKDDGSSEKGNTDGGTADGSNASKTKLKKKLPFEERSDFRPGWEDELTKYKRSLRLPPLLINLSRAGSSSQHSTSLPDVDTGPNSPALSVATDNTDWNAPQPNVDLLDSDLDSASNCQGMDSDATCSSVISTSTIRKRNPRSSQLLDQLVEKVVNRGGGLKAGLRKEGKKEISASPLRAIRRNAAKGPEALPTPTPGLFQYQAFNNNKPITNFRDAFRANGMLQQEDKKVGRGRASKPTSNIRAVFGEDHPNEEGRTSGDEPKSAHETKKRETQVKKEKIRAKIERRRHIPRRSDKGSIGVVLRPRRGNGAAAGGRPGLRSAALVRRSKAVLNSKQQMLQRRKRRETFPPPFLATAPSTSTELQPQTFLRRKIKLRRKFRSGFDYIRKKKRQQKKDDTDSNKDKKKCIIVRPNPESEEDIQAEIRNWVMKKGLGETILHRAAKLGFADVTAFCLEKMDFSPSARDNAGYTPLHVACSRGHTDIAHLLLMYGANVSDSVQGGIRPLHEAAERNHVEMLRLLLAYGADPLLATYSGQTALSLTSPDSDASRLLQNHLRDVQGLTSQKWFFAGPASCFDTCPLVDDPAFYPSPPSPPSPDASNDLSDLEVEMSDSPILPLYQLLSEPSERYVLVSELLTALRIKNKRNLFKLVDGEEVESSEMCGGGRCSGGRCSCNSGSDSDGLECTRAGFKVLNESDFMEQARCCNLLSAGDKVKPKWKKVELIRYNDRVKQLLGVQMVRIPVR